MNKTNWIISTIVILTAIFSILVILFDIGVIPPIFGSSDHAAEINKALVNVSYSYFAGVIFALLTIYFPRIFAQYSALCKSQTTLLALVHELTWCSAVLKFIKDKEPIKIGSRDDPYAINPVINNLKEIEVVENRFYVRSVEDCGGQAVTRIEYVDVVSDLNNACYKISEMIDKMKRLSYYGSLSIDLLALIDKVEKLRLLNDAKLLSIAVEKNLIIAENFTTYSSEGLGDVIAGLSNYIKSGKRTTITFNPLSDYETEQYKRWLTNNREHGDLYRELGMNGRVYDGDMRM